MPLGTVLNCNGNRNEKIMSVDTFGGKCQIVLWLIEEMVGRCQHYELAYYFLDLES